MLLLTNPLKACSVALGGFDIGDGYEFYDLWITAIGYKKNNLRHANLLFYRPQRMSWVFRSKLPPIPADSCHLTR